MEEKALGILIKETDKRCLMTKETLKIINKYNLKKKKLNGRRYKKYEKNS